MDVKAELQRLGNTTRWSVQGVAACWQREKSFRQWLGVNVLNVIAVMLVDLTPGERALLLFAGLLVVIMEVLNSAIEETIDYISEEKDPRAGRAKDYGSAAVMLTAIGGGMAWLVILLG